MKKLTGAMITFLLLTGLPLLAQAGTNNLDISEPAGIQENIQEKPLIKAPSPEKSWNWKGGYWGLSLGTPGGINLAFGYFWQNFGLSINSSVMPAVTLVEYIWNVAVAGQSITSGDYENGPYANMLVLISNQVNCYFTLLHGKNYLFAASVLGGHMFYYLQDTREEINAWYGGVALNLFYKNIFLEIGIVSGYDSLQRNIFAKYPVVPTLQVGYVYHY